MDNGKAKRIIKTIQSTFEKVLKRQGKNETSFKKYIAKDRVFDDYVFDFAINDEIGASWYDGSPQQVMPERRWCKNKILAGNTVVDCGAHHGMMTVLFSHWVGPRGKVIAFEPLEESASVITQNANLNNLKNIEVQAKAVGVQNGLFPINKTNSNTMMGKESVIGISKSSDNMVESVRLDDALANLDVDFMKIDVEGFELEALGGAQSILKQRPVLDIEMHCFAFSDRKKFIREFIDLIPVEDYDFEVLEEIFSPIKRIENIKELEGLIRFDNPHLLCTPKL